ncbi:MAG: type III pantothenate kinase, partial [Anaerolineales bacterium]|nr:type III pantothenate kinase [Anaerolineales bacterium]
KGEQLLAKWHLFTDIYKTADEYTVLLRNMLSDKDLAMDDINGAIVSCVAPQLLYIFEGLCKRSFGFRPLIVGAGIRTGVKLNYDNPREVGADRVVNAVAAHYLYKEQMIVIDFGTATSLEVVSADGDFLGGAVAPGIGISAEALFKQTAMLPRVELHSPGQAIGKNTVAAVQSGLIYGYVGLIEGLVERMKRELDGDAKVIATGGLAPVIARETSAIDEVVPELTLVGLRLIYELNVQHPQRKRGG